MTVHDPDVCQCNECCMRVFEWLNRRGDALSIEGGDYMRKGKLRVVEVSVVRGRGELPGFLPLIHRHFEKSIPAVKSDKEGTVNASLDLLDLLVPAALLASIDSLEIIYRKGA